MRGYSGLVVRYVWESRDTDKTFAWFKLPHTLLQSMLVISLSEKKGMCG